MALNIISFFSVRKTILALLIYVAGAILSVPASAQDTVMLNFVNADIPSVVKAIGAHTGKNFIIDPRVTGNMNIISQTPVSKDLAYQILLSALRVHGFAAIEERGVVKIVPEADGKTSGIVVGRGAQVNGDRIVTQVFTLQNESAAQLATVLRPLVAPNNFIGAYPGNNTLVITDYAENVKRIARIIASIDVPASTDLQMIRLQYASAVDVAALLGRLMPETAANPASPGAPPKLAIGVEPRTNSLLLRADTPALVTRIKALVAGIDIPTAANGNIYVVYLRNAEATKLAETLRGLLNGASASASISQPASTSTSTSSTGAASQTLSSASASSAPTQINSTIQAYTSTNSLVITAPDYVYNSLRAVIDKLDARRAQVFVEALIVEVSSSTAAEFGIQWQDISGLNRTGTQVIGGTNFGSRGGGANIIDAASNITSLGSGLNLGLVRGTVRVNGVDILSLGALARALEADQKNNVLSTPNILTLDNEEAKIVVGQNVPFVTGSYTQTTAAASSPFQTIERKDVGLTLRVTPQVTEGGTVKLKVFQEVSSVVPTTSSVRSADLITNKRSVENTVLADDGQIIVIGGLIQDDTKNNDSKVPILGDIPYLGNLFKYKTRNRDKTNLMIFLRPYVLRDGKAANQLTGERYDYIRNEQSNAIREGESLLPPTGGALLPALPNAAAPAASPLPGTPEPK
jgi:general secretion pathway protein D